MLKKILVVCILCCLHTACEEDFTSTIPFAPVNLIIDLMNYDDFGNIPSYRKFITMEDTYFPKKVYEFGFGGILVVRGVYGGTPPAGLFAYDLACPNEARHKVRVKPQSPGLQAICSECGAVYNIATGGAPESGSRYWLRRYNVAQIGETEYRITN